MINVREAIKLAAGRARTDMSVLPEFTEHEKTQLDYLDAIVDSLVCKSFDGNLLDIKIPTYMVGPHIVEALQRRYVDGGWQVGIFPVGDVENVVAYQFVLSASEKAVIPGTYKKTGMLPVVYRATSDAVAKYDCRLLVRMPTRGRAAQALEVLQKYRDMAGCVVEIEVVVDEDDQTMLNAEVMQRLAALGCVVTVGHHASKVEACNGGRVRDWDVLVLASDDMHPVVDGYAVHILDAMKQHWPHLDGALHFNDGFQLAQLCTLPIFGRRLWEQFGYVYEPQYASLFCDREQTDVLKALGRLAYVNEKIIEHRHHAWGRAEKDALYERNDALESADKAVYEARKARGFDAPKMLLSILICTLPQRRAQCKWLVDHLYAQIIPNFSRKVEILIDDREQPVTIGEKRQALLERAHGTYVCFVDDDDGVPHDYVRRLYQALVHGEPDCASLVGMMTTRGGKPERFEHSIKYSEWRTVKNNGVVIHERYPNHLNALRKSLALEVGFISRNVGEDHNFSTRIKPLLKSEASTGDEPLYLYWWDPAQSVQNQGDAK